MRLIDADELKKCAIPCEIHNGALTDLCVPLYQIDNAPTVEPEWKRPHGRWVLNCKRYYCSECGEDAINLESEPDVFASNYCLTNYCPNCGADMRHDKNELTFGDWLKEQLKDPEFRKMFEKLCEEVQNGLDS